jgi:hypothetical protein
MPDSQNPEALPPPIAFADTMASVSAPRVVTLPPGAMATLPIGSSIHAPWYLWAMCAGFLIGVGVLAGVLFSRFQLNCVVDSENFSAKTTVCKDKQAYALVPMAADVKVLERSLHTCQLQVQEFEQGSWPTDVPGKPTPSKP